MDKTVLLEKRKNLLSTSKNAQEIFLTSNFVDLMHFFNENELLEFLLDTNDKILKISKKDLIENINQFLMKQNDVENLKLAFESLQLEGLKINFENQNNKEFEQIQKDVIKKVVNYLINQLDRINQFNTQSVLENHDSSVWKLYFSYGILEGLIKFPNKEDLYVRAPLINVELLIEKNESGDLVFRKNRTTYIANELLELQLDTMLEAKSNLSINLDQENLDFNQYFEKLSEYLTTVKVDQVSSKFIKKQKHDLSLEPISIKKCFLAVFFNPIGGKMLKDYDQIIAQDYQFPYVDTIFHEKLDDKIYQDDDIYEINHPLNLVQKLAIINASKDNVLIYGPPGTGKSEVVANLIANNLINNQTICVISEKKAALDVIHERLLSLNTITMTAINNKYKDEFYNKINEINFLISATNPIQLIKNNYSYKQLKAYYQDFQDVINYVDVFNNDLKQFLILKKDFQSLIFNQNKQAIRLIYNHFKDHKFTITFDDFRNNIINLQEVCAGLCKLLGVNEIPKHIFDKQLLKSFLDQYETKCQNNYQFSSLKNFILNNKMIFKKPFFEILDKKNTDSNLVIELKNFLLRIINENISYVSGYEAIYYFVNNNPNYLVYLSYYDWLSNTKISTLLDKFRSKNIAINALINNYWNDKLTQCLKFDKIIRNHYIINLRNRLKISKELESHWIELLRKANLVKRPNINRIIKDYYTTLKAVFPIWILSPDSAASILPLRQNEFDVGIFDEASQMRIERGMSLVYRCRKNIISGDDKQLRPSMFFAKSFELDETYEGHLDNVDSLLDKARSSNWVSYTLSNHYRSDNEALINFSNHYFYDDKLLCITKNHHFENCIDLYEFNATYDRMTNTNQIEAEHVIELLIENLEKYQSIIVITLNSKQAELIESMVFANLNLLEAYESFKIKIRSLENVQGDEGDLVIISLTFGYDKNNKFVSNFGPINQSGGKNRINVMVSRAKRKMIVLKSFKAADINVNSNENTLIFKHFISYVESYASHKGVFKLTKKDSYNDSLDQIYDVLKGIENIVVEKNYQIGSHKFDLVIMNQLKTEIKLLIIYDKFDDLKSYSDDFSAFVKNMDHQRYYEDRNYKTYRINELEWIINQKGIIDFLKSQVN